MLQFTAYLLQAQNVCSLLFLSIVGLGPWWVGGLRMATGKRLESDFHAILTSLN